MAARTTRIVNDANTRKKIQATQLINRLTKHALSDEEIMTQSQVTAARILLGKTLPDLQAIAHEGPGENGEFPIVTKVEREIVG